MAVAARQPWAECSVPVIAGLGDTRLKAKRAYDVRPLGELFNASVCALPKERAPAFLPSTYAGHDARAHDVQKAQGRFVALVGDVDNGNVALAPLRAAVEAFAGQCAWSVYSTASACADARRWRVVVPLAEPVGFAQWFDAQMAFAAHMNAWRIPFDTCASRPGQIAFLPNVPVDRRGPDGQPLYFEQAGSSTDCPGLVLGCGPVADGIAAIVRQRAEDDQKRQAARDQMQARRRSSRSSGDANVIEDFNAGVQLETLMEAYHYSQSPRDGRDWRSPNQTSGSYATRIMDGGKWHSLSGSDAASGLGASCASGCFGDAFDLFVHFEHGGDFTGAVAALHREREAMNGDQGRSDWGRMNFGPQAVEPEDMGAANDDDGSSNALMPTLDLAALAVCAPKPKAFAVERLAPLGEVTLFTGPGSAGKSLFGQQLATCAAAGVQCLGLDVMACPALYVTCEDDQDQLHWRQASICAALGAPMADLDGKLHLSSLRGALDNELGTFSSDGILRPAAAFRRLVGTLKATGSKLAILDNVAHLFTGNENDRGEVTRFVNLLNRLAGETGAAIILIGHPNKAGDSYSGSTAWLNAVRSQITVEHDLETDLRTLTVGKSNYSRKGEALRFVWHEGAFLLERDLTPDVRAQLAEIGKANFENDTFLACLAARAAQGVERAVGPNAGPNYAPTQFEGMPQAKGLKKAALKRAMDRLYSIGRVRTDEVERPGKSGRKSIIVEVLD